MSFNLLAQTTSSGGSYGYGSNNGTAGSYHYETVAYRKWVNDVAIAFYQGRQDGFVFDDMVKQFRQPDKQQIFTINLTAEVIDESSILYNDSPVYKVLSKGNKKISKRDQKLWEEIQKQSKYQNIMDQLDKFTQLLGTVMLKVGYVDSKTGKPWQSPKKNEKPAEGSIQLKLLWNGTYDVRFSSSPYFITELYIGLTKSFGGYDKLRQQMDKISETGSFSGAIGPHSTSRFSTRKDLLSDATDIFWSLDKFRQVNEKTKEVYEGKNPYGFIPAVPFFNKEPIDYFFLPVDEPLLYANHAINMRLSDLNHIAKFQSFATPVLKGAERGTSIRRGRPVDDLNELGGGSASSQFIGLNRAGAFGSRNSLGFSGIGFNDGNADAVAVGLSIGPDTGISTGRNGDFRYESPGADIRGLSEVIMHMADWMRITHGLKPKFKQADIPPSSGYALLMEKLGVMEDNIRRQKLFRERETELAYKMMYMWNIHHKDEPERRFTTIDGNFDSELDVEIDINYVQPTYPVDPQTRIIQLQNEMAIIESGDRRAIKELFKDKTDNEIEEMIINAHNDKLDQLKRNLELRRMESELDLELETKRAALAVGGEPGAPSQKPAGKEAPEAPARTKPRISNMAEHVKKSSENQGK